MALIAAVQRRGAGDRLGIGGAEIALWSPLASRAMNLSDAPLAGIEELCAAGRVPVKLPPTALPAYGLGDRVAHPHFGQGVIVAIESAVVGKKAECYLTVRFSERKLVKLLAGVAPLSRV
jgi:hypothetical protein